VMTGAAASSRFEAAARAAPEESCTKVRLVNEVMILSLR